MTLDAIEARPTQRDALIERHVVADLGRLADHDAHPVVDEDALTERRPGMDLDAGQKAYELREKAR